MKRWELFVKPEVSGAMPFAILLEDLPVTIASKARVEDYLSKKALGRALLQVCSD